MYSLFIEDYFRLFDLFLEDFIILIAFPFWFPFIATEMAVRGYDVMCLKRYSLLMIFMIFWIIYLFSFKQFLKHW